MCLCVDIGKGVLYIDIGIEKKGWCAVIDGKWMGIGRSLVVA